MHADVTGLPVVVCECSEGPLLGCATLGEALNLKPYTPNPKPSTFNPQPSTAADAASITHP
jgi:hypothetical protein